MWEQGSVIGGSYQIIREIGRGGASIVYLAFHLRLQKYVALKKARLNRTDIGYLRNEVDTLKELHHSALPQVYDFLEVNQDIYTVIDYIDGEDFDKLIAEGYRFSEEQITEYMLTLAEALEYIHTHEPPVLHSDIKPGNIMLRRDGTVCLIDFNISVFLGSQGELYGFSRYYTAPEQQWLATELANHSPITASIDGRSDIYSLGAAFYYIMSGYRPWEDGVLYPLSSSDTGYSADLIKIVSKCMEEDPESRYQTASELAAVLRRQFRRGADFRERCLYQALLLGFCGLILCCGIWSLTYGLRTARYESFLAEVQEVQMAGISGSASKVVIQGVDILNTYEDQSTRSPERWYQLLVAVGDGYVSLGEDDSAERRDLWELAADYYKDAAIFAAENDMDATTECVIDWACLLLKMGQPEQIGQATELRGYLSESQLWILDILQEAGASDEAEIMQRVEQAGQEDQRMIYLALASVRSYNGDVQGEIYYLEQANSIESSITLTEELAAACMEAGKQDTSYYTKAVTFYETLIAGSDTSLSIRLGYAAALRASEDLERAKSEIDALLQSNSDNFDVLAQAAMIYSQLGENEIAADYASRAMKSEPDREQTEIWPLLEKIAAG